MLDSLRYWANEVQIDGFRFDLAATLGRDADVDFDPRPSAARRRSSTDPALEGVKMIAEPWDVGIGRLAGRQLPARRGRSGTTATATGCATSGCATSPRRAPTASPSEGIGSLARRLAGSNHVFSLERGPLASVNFITAHDGFTAADLVAYDDKHNLGNGENNRDGSNDNKSFNHGVEGATDGCRRARGAGARPMRNLLGTLLLSAGIPMLTAGDEFGRTPARQQQRVLPRRRAHLAAAGSASRGRSELLAVARQLIRLRRENPALRPVRFGRFGETIPSASQMDWYNKQGLSMSLEDWDSPAERTLQYLAASTPEFEEFNRILLVVHGLETTVTVTLPEHEGVTGYTLLWDSSHDDTRTACRARAEHARRATERSRSGRPRCGCSERTEALRPALAAMPPDALRRSPGGTPIPSTRGRDRWWDGAELVGHATTGARTLGRASGLSGRARPALAGASAPVGRGAGLTSRRPLRRRRMPDGRCAPVVRNNLARRSASSSSMSGFVLPLRRRTPSPAASCRRSDATLDAGARTLDDRLDAASAVTRVCSFIVADRVSSIVARTPAADLGSTLLADAAGAFSGRRRARV